MGGVANKLLEKFGIGTDPVLGLDIGSTAIKVMQLSKKGEQIQVEWYACAPLEPGWVVEKNIINRDAVIAALKDLIKKQKISSNKVCVAIPSSASITKVLKMSGDLTDKEIGSEIQLEAEKYIPYHLDEVNLDYTVIGPSEEEGLVNILLAVSKMENVDKIIDLVTDSGLEAVIVDIDSFAVQRVFKLVIDKLPGQGKDKVIAVLDIGATLTTLNVVHNNKIVYTREQAFGGQQLVDEIENRYGLTYEEAVLAVQFQNLPDDYFLEVLEPYKQTVTQQVKRFCQFFFSSGDYTNIDYIFLAGGGGAISGLDTVVQNKMQIKTFMADPFAGFKISNKVNVDSFKRDAARLVACCGLALRNVT